MKRILLYSLSAMFLASLAVSCSSPDINDIPTPKAHSGSQDLTYLPYGQPEHLVDVTATYAGYTGFDGQREEIAVLGQTQVAGGNKIWYKAPTSNKLFPVPWRVLAGPNGGGAKKIAYASKNHLYAVTSPQNELWRYSSGVWTKLPYSAVDVAAYEEQYVYFLGAASVGGGHPIFRLMPDGSAIEVVPGGGAVALTVDPFGRPWIVSNVRDIFVGPLAQVPAISGTWQQIDGKAVDIAYNQSRISVLGQTYYSHGHEVYSRTASPGPDTFVGEGGEGIQIAGSDTGKLFVVTAEGELWNAPQ